MKNAMRAKDKPRLGAIRLIQAEIKRIEVDERIEIDDARLLAVLDKMVKQRRDSISQFEEAGRQELADKEQAEIAVIQDFLPEALSEGEINGMIDEDEAMQHEERHLVTNCVGSENMRIEIGSSIEMSVRDTLVLASDGLSDNMAVSDIIETLRCGNLTDCAQQLTARART